MSGQASDFLLESGDPKVYVEFFEGVPDFAPPPNFSRPVYAASYNCATSQGGCA